MANFAMKRFALGQRIRVHHTDKAAFLGGAPGTVVRLRRADDGAWIELDERSAVPNAHPFPQGDARERHVLCYPPGCSEAL
jgi:hypothetical protein